MTTNNENRKPGGVGGGKMDIPQAAALRRPGKKFQMPVNRAALKPEMDLRIAEVEENKATLHALADWLIDIGRANQAEKDQYASETLAYAGDLELATKDPNPAIRRVGAYELFRWKFSDQFVTWDDLGEVVVDLASKGILIQEADPEKFLVRYDQTGYIIEAGLEIEPAQLAEIKTWVARIAGEIRTHTLREWEAEIGRMRQTSVITLEQLVLGEPGPCYMVVPDDLTHKGRDGKVQQLEGGHLLVNSVNGKVFVEAVAGDPTTGKGFAFVRRMLQVKDLHPRAFLSAYKLRFWSPFVKLKPDMKPTEAQEKAQAFFDQNVDHAKACTVVHASIKRAIVLAANKGEFDNSGPQVKYLGGEQDQAGDQPSPKEAEPTTVAEEDVKSEPVVVDGEDKKAKKGRGKKAKKDTEPAASAT